MGEERAGEFGPEWLLLESLCRDVDTDRARRAVGELVARVHWGELMEQAIRHKMLPAVAHHMVRVRPDSPIPLRVLEHLRSMLAMNLYRRRVWYGEVARVVAALTAGGVRLAARKGAAYESSIYEGDGRRWLGDIDLLISPAGVRAVPEIMESLGYQSGLYDFDREVIVPFDRRERLKYQLNPDHLPTYSFMTGDPLVPVIEVDFATSLTWARAPYQIPTEDALARIDAQPVRGVGGIPVPVMDPAYQFLDTVLHLFREAWIDWWLEMEQDVDLMKFGDVIRLWHRYGDQLASPGFLTLVEKYDVVEPVCWVLEHLDRTFGTGMVTRLGLSGRVSEDFLASAGGGGSGARVWKGTMRDRLYTKARRQLFAPSVR